MRKIEMTHAKEPDGHALIRAKRRGVAHYKKEVERQRNLGFSDHQLVQAMVKSNVLVDPLGSKPPLRRPR
jgi:hypothetical protein